MKNVIAGFAAMMLGISGVVSAGDIQEDGGYFLTFPQKLELIGRGEITDARKNVYDVWLCPGYVYPTEFARDAGWVKGTEAFGEYFESKKYKDLADNSGDCFEFAWEDCIEKGLIDGVPEAWNKYFSQASERVDKRVFGWFMAYPTAFVQAFSDNLFRIPITITGCVMGTAAGITVVPGYYALNSGIEGAGRYLVPGTLVPLSGYTFNTLISPPLSLLGQRPDESRVDGFWVAMTPAEQVAARKLQAVPLTDDEMGNYVKWARNVHTELMPFDKEFDHLQTEFKIEHRKLQNEMQTLSNRHQRALDKIEKERNAAYQKLRDNAQINDTKINPFRIQGQESKFREYLSKQGLSAKEINEIIKMIHNQNRQLSGGYSYRNGVDNSIKKYRKADPAVESMKKSDQIIRDIH